MVELQDFSYKTLKGNRNVVAVGRPFCADIPN